jgi:glycosyltransferase involved in cell wall biosynthesis
MKIALLNRDEATHVGGDAVQLRGYQKSLSVLGYQADYIGQTTPDLRGYDEAWLFHINFPWCGGQFQAAKTANIPVRLFPIYYAGSVVTALDVFSYARAIYPLSGAEQQEMIQELKLDDSTIAKMHAIPNGVDKSIFRNRGDEHTDLSERRYVMTAGRYEQYKGQQRVAEAATGLGLPFLTVGTVWHSESYERCKALAIGTSSQVLGNVSQDELASLYSRARVYCCASTSERNNLAILEAAACGATVINSIDNRGHDWLACPAINPADSEQLRQAIWEAAWHPHDYSAEVLSWDAVVQEILKW